MRQIRIKFFYYCGIPCIRCDRDEFTYDHEGD